MTVTLVQPYDSSWPSQFVEVKAFVESGLAGVNHTIEHVGSTAIPGMMAKPIIDIDIVIAPETFPKVKEQLEAKVLIERWRTDYNHVRPHSALDYYPPAPQARVPWPVNVRAAAKNMAFALT